MEKVEAAAETRPTAQHVPGTQTCLPRLTLLLPPLLLLLLAGQQSLATRPLLVFLIDGFRYDYMDDLSALPGFRELASSGVKVDYMTPDFPVYLTPTTTH
ncbi:hypothetical protein F7725_009570 [Dissostichus mawsoni]|uniref:Ectonucleotide pyrophosphatase/phosphodiesterase family member 6 n=1 Tax=Dissostichus mawsoni TaxID=36200 RepID=A0A7J5XL42_DISMA|nr:hypothetical protein F7725_009570 [Dissostichus mawsoni]